MHSPTRVTHSNIAEGDAVTTCARDLRTLLERRIGTVTLCNVHVDRIYDMRTRGESFRIKLHIAAEPFDVQLTMTPQADVYMALTKTFDQAAWLMPRLREQHSPTLLRKLRAIAIDAWHVDSRRYRERPSSPGDEVRLS